MYLREGEGRGEGHIRVGLVVLIEQTSIVSARSARQANIRAERC